MHTLILALARMRQEDQKFKPSLSYIIRLSGIHSYLEGRKAGRQTSKSCNSAWKTGMSGLGKKEAGKEKRKTVHETFMKWEEWKVAKRLPISKWPVVTLTSSSDPDFNKRGLYFFLILSSLTCSNGGHQNVVLLTTMSILITPFSLFLSSVYRAALPCWDVSSWTSRTWTVPQPNAS